MDSDSEGGTSPPSAGPPAGPTGGRAASWRWRAPCGDRLERHGDALTVHAVFPIEGLELSRFRNPVLRVRGERFTLAAVEGDPRAPIYRFMLEVENLYAPPGELFLYDGNRHVERAQERRRTALAWLLFLPLIPLTPVLGLLPESLKVRLMALGLDPGRASRQSLVFEWALLFFAVLAYFLSGGLLTAPGAILGSLCLLLALDITYRVASDYEGRAPGIFGVVLALKTWVVESWRGRHGLDLPPPPPPPSDQEPPPPGPP